METKDITIVKKTNYTINYEVFKDYVYFEINKVGNKKKWDAFAMPIKYFNENLDPKNKQSFNKLINVHWGDKYMAFKKSFLDEYYAGTANWTETDKYINLLNALRKGKTDTIFRDRTSDDGFLYVGDKPVLKGVRVTLMPTDFKDFKDLKGKLEKNKKISNMEMVSTDHWEREGRSEYCYEKLVFTYTPSKVEFNKLVDSEEYWSSHMEWRAKEALELKKHEIADY